MNSNKKIKFDSIDLKGLTILAELKSKEKIDITSIEYICSAKTFSNVFLKNKTKFLVRKSLNEWENLLPGNLFVRVNRATIINLAFVKQIRKASNHTLEFILNDFEKPLIMSRGYVHKLKGNLII